MISNPKVGMRAAVTDMYGVLRIATVVEVVERRLVRVEDGGWSAWFGVGSVRDAAALRSEAQRLIEAAEKLEQESMMFEPTGGEDDDMVPCDLCGALWDLCGNGEGVVVQRSVTTPDRTYTTAGQIKLCIDCAIQVAVAIEDAFREGDICEHGVVSGEWCEPCNLAYKAARFGSGDED